MTSPNKVRANFHSIHQGVNDDVLITTQLVAHFKIIVQSNPKLRCFVYFIDTYFITYFMRSPNEVCANYQGIYTRG